MQTLGTHFDFSTYMTQKYLLHRFVTRVIGTKLCVWTRKIRHHQGVHPFFFVGRNRHPMGHIHEDMIIGVLVDIAFDFTEKPATTTIITTARDMEASPIVQTYNIGKEQTCIAREGISRPFVSVYSVEH